jgi:DNA-binding CsgD family transcriptional regulator
MLPKGDRERRLIELTERIQTGLRRERQAARQAAKPASCPRPARPSAQQAPERQKGERKRQERIVELLRAGTGVRSIAQMLGVHPSTVYRTCRRVNLPLPPPPPRRPHSGGRRLHPTSRQMQKLLLGTRCTFGEIAARLGCSLQQVRRRAIACLAFGDDVPGYDERIC